MLFRSDMEGAMTEVGLDSSMLHRSLNMGFSGGEKKKNEILQMRILKPKMIILDELDSGLDVDSLRIVGESVMRYYEQFKPSILLITHYQKLLDYIKPDFVHIMKNGHIIKSGDFSLVDFIEKYGYDLNKLGISTKENDSNEQDNIGRFKY